MEAVQGELEELRGLGTQMETWRQQMDDASTQVGCRSPRPPRSCGPCLHDGTMHSWALALHHGTALVADLHHSVLSHCPVDPYPIASLGPLCEEGLAMILSPLPHRC